MRMRGIIGVYILKERRERDEGWDMMKNEERGEMKNEKGRCEDGRRMGEGWDDNGF